jgi:hypothetical protein
VIEIAQTGLYFQQIERQLNDEHADRFDLLWTALPTLSALTASLQLIIDTYRGNHRSNYETFRAQAALEAAKREIDKLRLYGSSFGDSLLRASLQRPLRHALEAIDWLGKAG